MPVRIVTLGPEGTYSHQAARKYTEDADIVLVGTIPGIYNAFSRGEADMAIAPVYNTIDGPIQESFTKMLHLKDGLYWIDNVVIPIRHALGSLDADSELTELWSKETALRQCEEYTDEYYPGIATVPVSSTAAAAEEVKQKSLHNVGVIASQEALESRGLVIRNEELVKNNRTRFGVFGREKRARTGYDASGILVLPSPIAAGHYGWLAYATDQFGKRKINLLEAYRYNDPVSRAMVFYFECEGHIDSNPEITEAMESIRNPSITSGEGTIASSVVRFLGSYPRAILEEREIGTIGFIGTGSFTDWHMDLFGSQGYKTVKTGRSTAETPEEMIRRVDAVAVCVPISAAPEVTRKYLPLLKPGQLWIDLTGEKEETMKEALRYAQEGVEVIGIHELFGPKVTNIGRRNVVIVDGRKGKKSDEIEALYRRNLANVVHDDPVQHDLYVGSEMKMPHAAAFAMARVFKNHGISPKEMGNHSTATSVYMHMLMARVHGQNPGTYAEIQASNAQGSKLIGDLIEELRAVKQMGDEGDLEGLKRYIEENREHLEEAGFLADNMELSQAFDELVSRTGRRV